MSLLTQVIPSRAGARAPLMIEAPLAKELDGPFLITTTTGLAWIANKFPSGYIRSAVRKVPLPFIFRDAILRVARESDTQDWGSRQPPTPEGLGAAIAHLKEYGLDPVEVLYGTGFNSEMIPSDIPFREVGWIPRGWAVVLPHDRSYVGTTVDFGGGRLSLVLHNPSRGVAIVAPPLPSSEALGPYKKLMPKTCLYLEDVAAYSAEELLGMKGVGKKTFEKIREVLSAHGVKLRGE